MVTSSNIVTGAVLAQFLIGVILFIGAFIIRHEPIYYSKPQKLFKQNSFQAHDSGYDKCSALMTPIVILTLVALGILMFTDAFVGLWQPLFSKVHPTFHPIQWPFAMTIVFNVDILIVSYLVFKSGGSRNSPFQPVFFLIPTLAIFLREPARWVVFYAGLVALLFLILNGDESHRPEEKHNTPPFTRSYLAVSIACLVVATLIGIMTAP